MKKTRDPLAEFLELAERAFRDGTLVKLTLGDYRGEEAGLRNVYARPVTLAAGQRISFVYRYATRDITKNHTPGEALHRVRELLAGDFQSAHLFTPKQSADLRCRAGRAPRLLLGKPAHAAPVSTDHDRDKHRLVAPAEARWLQGVGVTGVDGAVAKGMEAKFRQINHYVEILKPLLESLPAGLKPNLRLVDMGCGKGYLTFAAYDFLVRHGWTEAEVTGIEARPELVTLGNRLAAEQGWSKLRFQTGAIADTKLEKPDVLVALHACDTATDDAIAQGIQAGAALILVAPCCHKELRPALRPPPALADTLRHGILRERQAEFVTDALRAALLEWAGYETRVFEFISTEHTPKNLMIAATKRAGETSREPLAQKVRELAAMYGIARQRLADQLNFSLAG